MTENRENMSIKYAVCVLEAIGNGLTLSNENDREDACVLAIQALEEIQAYRAIGTVEQLKTMFDGFWKLKDLCEEYEKFGLPEDYWKLNEMCKEYSAIGTIEEFKALKDKSEPRKPFQPFGTHSYKCPSCWKFVAHEVDDNCDLEAEMAGWCPYCGQKIDWQ